MVALVSHLKTALMFKANPKKPIDNFFREQVYWQQESETAEVILSAHSIWSNIPLLLG
jgi:hypothetical protein